MGVGFGVRLSILRFNFGVCVSVLFWGYMYSGYRFWGSGFLVQVYRFGFGFGDPVLI